MDAFASPSIRAEGRGWGLLRLAETAVLTLVLGLSLMTVPGPPDASLDASWQETLIQAHVHGLQFGKDIIFTWGPWGFLCSLFHWGRSGALPILIWETVGQLAAAFALVFLTRRLAPWRRLLFVAALLVFHWLFLDTVYFVLIALIGICGLMDRHASLVRIVLWTLILGFLAQLKFTYLVIAAGAVVASTACWIGRRSLRHAAAIPLGFGAGVLGAWCSAGQNLDNFYPYVLRSIEISSGYGDAMGLQEPWSAFAWGASLALLCAVFSWRLWVSVPERSFGRSAAAFLAFVFFVMWKESYTRADIVPLGGHILGLFGTVAIMATVAGGYFFPGRRWHWFDGGVLMCLTGLAFIDPQYYRHVVRVEWERFYGEVAVLRHLGDIPGAWESALGDAAAANALPAIKAAVGSGTVDVYDYTNAIAPLNGLAVSARPIFQGYSAYTPSLEGWNRRFYDSDKAPDFLLWSDARVDNRYPGMDDALLVAALPHLYAPVLSEQGYWLFRKIKKAAAEEPPRQVILRKRAVVSETIELPLHATHALWLQAEAIPNALGRARAFLYKPASLNLVTTDADGHVATWRMLPRVGKAGFLLVPTLLHGSDLVKLMGGDVDSRVTSIRFEADGDQAEFWDHMDVQVSSLPGLPLHPLSYTSLVESGIIDRRPVALESSVPPEVIDVPEGKALFLHADGLIAIDVPSGATRFTGRFGLRAGSYSEGGHTDGVAFEVDAVDPSGHRDKLWGRYLDPSSREGDRGTQRLNVELPLGRPLRLEFHTGPGPRKDYRWDWSYVARLRFDVYPAP